MHFPADHGFASFPLSRCVACGSTELDCCADERAAQAALADYIEETDAALVADMSAPAPAAPLDTFHTFRTTQDARTYRHETGCGGWIFASDDRSLVVLFPAHYTPAGIFAHPLTKGRSGDLIGNS